MFPRAIHFLYLARVGSDRAPGQPLRSAVTAYHSCPQRTENGTSGDPIGGYDHMPLEPWWKIGPGSLLFLGTMVRSYHWLQGCDVIRASLGLMLDHAFIPT